MNWIQLIGSFFGSLGFALLFHLRGWKAFWTALGGGMAWFVYLFVGLFYPAYGIQFLIASIVLGIYMEIMAYYTKMPRTAYIAVGIIPLIPGAALYRAMYSLLQKQMEAGKAYAFEALVTSTAIAAGLLIAMDLWKLIGKGKRKNKKSRKDLLGKISVFAENIQE